MPNSVTRLPYLCVLPSVNLFHLAEIKEEKDMGVWTINTLKPSLQCIKAASKAMSILQAIKRSFSSIDRKSFPILYKTYVRPHLEYCVQAWSPYLKKDTLHLEKVQQRATKLVRGLGNLPYEQRLQKLGL